MLVWWLAVELFFIAFFVYGYVIYTRRIEAYKREDATAASRAPTRGDDPT